MRRVALVILAAVAIAIAVPFALAWRSGIDAIEPPPRASFDQQRIARGALLATLGDCNACHTAEGGRTYAGGRALETPFGVIHGTNITPDPDTGLGRWSEAAFVRAMREGIDRDGRHLYPAFPYNHFTRITDEDLGALYAYLMTREPVRAEPPQNALSFPFNIRALVAGWNLLFLDRTPWQPDAQQSAEWNRGAYLVEGLAHCGACHTPRNALGGEKRDARFGGGEIEGWHAPALNANTVAPAPWTAERVFAYLRAGQEPAHGATTGPMAPVVHNLATVPESEVRAIAAYIASWATQGAAERRQAGEALLARVQQGELPLAAARDAPQDPGARVFAATCSVCHDAGRDAHESGRALNLALSTAVRAPTPRNLYNFILYGLRPDEGQRGRWMPGFATALTDEQIVALATWLRRAAGAEPWPDMTTALRQARRSTPEAYAER